MGSTVSVSQPHPSFSLPPISSHIVAIPASDFVVVADPSKQKSFKIRIKKISNDPSFVKGGGDSSVTVKTTESESSSITDPSKRKSPKIRIKHNSNISNGPSLAKKGDDSSIAARINGSESNPTFKVESLPSIKTQPTQAPTDQPVINPSDHVPTAVKKNQKKRRFSITLSRKEIEADIAEIEALAGLKRLRRPKKRDQPGWNIDKRQLDRLFPGLGYC